MAKRKNTKRSLCDPDNCPHMLSPTDKPTYMANLGWRFVCILITWLISQYGVSRAASSFFLALVLFSLPLILEYAKFRPASLSRRIVFVCAVVLCFVWCIGGFIGLAGILNLSTSNGVTTLVPSPENVALPYFSISISAVFWIMFINVLIAFLDWIMYDPPFVNQISNTVSNRSA